MPNLNSQKAIISGATGGMSRAVALAFAREGIETALMARNEERLIRLAEEYAGLNARALPVVCDIASVDSISASVEEAIQKLGGLNILFNCAGIHKSGKGHEVDLGEWEAMLRTNLRAHFTALSEQSAEASLFDPFLFEKVTKMRSAKLLSLPQRHKPVQPRFPQLNRPR